MATGYVSDDVVPASPDPPPASGGEGGPGEALNQHTHTHTHTRPLAPPSPARVPAVFSRLGGERSVWIHLAPPSLALPALPLRGGKRRGKGSRSPSFPSRYRSHSSSGERREGSSRYRQCSRERRDRSSDKKRSRRSRSRSPFRKYSEQRSCQMLESVISGFQKSLEAFGDNASNSSSAGASSRGTPSPQEERPAKSVSSSRQGGVSSSRNRAPSRLEEREREERSRHSTRRPDRSSGDRGQSPPRKRRRSHSPSALSFSGSDNVSLHPSDSLSNEVDGGSEMRTPTLPASVPPGADAGRSGSRTSKRPLTSAWTFVSDSVRCDSSGAACWRAP